MRLFVDTAKVIVTHSAELGPRHVLMMLLRNELDVGFLPGGQLEELAAAGAIDAVSFKVIEPRTLQGHSGITVSTRSYPEWTLAALVRVNEDPPPLPGCPFPLTFYFVGTRRPESSFAPLSPPLHFAPSPSPPSSRATSRTR